MQVVSRQVAAPACAGASYGYTIWCTTLVQLVTFGAACLVLLYFCFTSLCNWYKWHLCLLAWLQLGWLRLQIWLHHLLHDTRTIVQLVTFGADKIGLVE